MLGLMKKNLSLMAEEAKGHASSPLLLILSFRLISHLVASDLLALDTNPEPLDIVWRVYYPDI
jgi:hypothetical protein